MGLVALKVMASRRKRPDVSPMSMALTLAPLRRRTPRTNRGIPTFLTGHFRGGLVDVSAVDTGLPSASAQRGSCGAAGRSHPRSDPTGPAQLLLGAWRLWSDVGSGPGLSEPPPLHEGRDPLAKGCASCTKALPTWSTPIPPPVAPGPRALRPDDAGRHPICREQPRLPLAVRHAAAIAVGQSVLRGARRRNKTVLRRRAPH